jgi:hypothetical protein
MKSDTIFFLFLFFFFILPQLLKLLKLKKKPAKGKKPGLVGRISEQLQKIAREIEAQRIQSETTGMDTASNTASGDIWQALAEEEPPVVKKAVAEEKPQPSHQPPPAPEEDMQIPEIPKPEKNSADRPICAARKRTARKKKTAVCRYRNAPLQNAVIWSEILGKPVSLR